MPSGANIGEWSEFYVFLKVLSDRKLISADADLFPIPGQDVPVIKVFHDETGSAEKTYDLSSQNSEQIIFSQNGSTPVVLDAQEISSKLNTIFNKILAGSTHITEGDELMRYLNCSHRRGMPHGSKEDIAMIVHDPRTGQEPRMAYSIKSQVGSPSTLLNASGATNFLFEATNTGQNLDLTTLNSNDRTKSRIDALMAAGMNLKYSGVSNNVFKQNMELIDTFFPDIMATLLLRHYTSNKSGLMDVLDTFGSTIELSSGAKVEKSAVIYKVKRFLVAVALGMTPSRAWSGTLSATGGYLILKPDGELVCYHIFNINSFEDYLLRSTKFERGGESRHRYGEFYKEGEKNLIKLNLQIRFTK